MEEAKHVVIVTVLAVIVGAVLLYWLLSHLKREGITLRDVQLFFSALIMGVAFLVLAVGALIGAVAFLVWIW
jgi:hypothetical protein